MDNNQIVVGYDGSAGARAALRWALDEAGRHQAPVHLVHVVERPLRAVPAPPMPGETRPGDQHRRAQGQLDDAIAEAAAGAPAGVEVTGAVPHGPAATVLCEQSERARLLVLGSRGLGGFTGLFVGSVSLAVATHAHCPVVVVRGDDQPPTADRPIAVGIDESAEAQLAIGFALEEAAVRDADVLAVRAWTPLPPPWHSDIPVVVDSDLETAQRHMLSKALYGWQEKYPGLTVDTRLVCSDARHALTAASRDAQLVVVGSRGYGGFGGLLLGSVGHYLLHHAACPVAVVRQRAQRR